MILPFGEFSVGFQVTDRIDEYFKVPSTLDGTQWIQ